MNAKSSLITIPVSELLVDPQNPRLPEMKQSQEEVIRLMLKAQGSKILSMAQHLTTNGTNPASLPIVIPAPDQKKKYYTLDGNRRLTALRLLELPELGDGILDGLSSQKIKTLAQQYKSSPIGEFLCVVFDDRKQADPWVQLIHRGQMQGAGLVEWDGQVAARYDERRGTSARGASSALQILEMVKNDNAVSQKTREKIESGKFPITNLTRLINTPYVRKKIGLEMKNDTVESFEDQTVKDLIQIVEDIGTEQITVTDIKRVDQRIDYIDKISGPSESTENQPSPESSEVSSAAPSIVSDIKKKAGKEKKPRSTIIPKEFLATVTQGRINMIFRELKKLDVDLLPNAGAVLTRVFLELSVDHYLDETLKWNEQRIHESKLSEKLKSTANDFKNKGILTEKQIAPILKAADGQTWLVTSVKTLNAYVHNKYLKPVPSELRTTWDDLELFVSKIWPH